MDTSNRPGAIGPEAATLEIVAAAGVFVVAAIVAV
jgi:hypothetical protein